MLFIDSNYILYILYIGSNLTTDAKGRWSTVTRGAIVGSILDVAPVVPPFPLPLPLPCHLPHHRSSAGTHRSRHPQPLTQISHVQLCTTPTTGIGTHAACPLLLLLHARGIYTRYLHAHCVPTLTEGRYSIFYLPYSIFILYYSIFYLHAVLTCPL